MKSEITQQIGHAVAVLKQGGVALFPTETSYGLAVDATNPCAVKRLMRLKGRRTDKSFPLIVASTAMADRIGHLRCLGHRLAKAYWPGPLTLVVKERKGSGLARDVVRDGTIALRVSSHPVARELSRRLGRPIVSTSANKAGFPSAYRVEDAGVAPDAVLNVGRLSKKKSSTVVSIVDKQMVVLRKGDVRPVDPKC